MNFDINTLSTLLSLFGSKPPLARSQTQNVNDAFGNARTASQYSQKEQSQRNGFNDIMSLLPILCALKGGEGGSANNQPDKLLNALKNGLGGFDGINRTDFNQQTIKSDVQPNAQTASLEEDEVRHTSRLKADSRANAKADACASAQDFFHKIAFAGDEVAKIMTTLSHYV